VLLRCNIGNVSRSVPLLIMMVDSACISTAALTQWCVNQLDPRAGLSPMLSQSNATYSLRL
jgi:hypothetical protein